LRGEERVTHKKIIGGGRGGDLKRGKGLYPHHLGEGRGGGGRQSIRLGKKGSWKTIGGKGGVFLVPSQEEGRLLHLSGKIPRDLFGERGGRRGEKEAKRGEKTLHFSLLKKKKKWCTFYEWKGEKYCTVHKKRETEGAGNKGQPHLRRKRAPSA